MRALLWPPELALSDEVAFLAQEHGPALQVMRRLKQALDPKGIMNPGVIFDVPELPFELPLSAPVGLPPHAGIDEG